MLSATLKLRLSERQLADLERRAAQLDRKPSELARRYIAEGIARDESLDEALDRIHNDQPKEPTA